MLNVSPVEVRAAIRNGTALLMLLWLTGCSTSAPVTSGGGIGTVPVTRGIPAPSTEGVTVPPSGNAAVIALEGESDRYLAGGRAEAAAASLERALRLTPGDAMLWHRLARVRLEQSRWDQCIELAQKSNSLAAGNRALQVANWKLVSRAQAALGNSSAAQAAARKAAALMSGE